MNHFRMKTRGRKRKVMWSATLIFIGVISFVGLAVADEQGEKRSSTISIEDFVKSPVAEFFQAGDYEHALKALEPLIQQYPKDPLLIRYRAMALDRLGRSKEAISILQELLKQDPEHVPTRYFLGEAYERSGDRGDREERHFDIERDAERRGARDGRGDERRRGSSGWQCCEGDRDTIATKRVIVWT